MKTKEKIICIKMHPEMHRHSYSELVICCTEDGVLSTALLQAHQDTFGKSNGGVRCDVMEGPCSCGAWHGGNN